MNRKEVKEEAQILLRRALNKNLRNPQKRRIEISTRLRLDCILNKLENELKNDFKRQLDKAKNNLNLHTSADKPNLNASMFLSIISQMLKSNYKLECDALEAHFDRKLSHEKDLLKSKFQVYTQQRISQEEELLEDKIRNERERITRTIEQEEKIEIDKQPIIWRGEGGNLG